MKNKFKGWQSVFGFTFKQSTKGVGFKLVTVLMSLLILGGFILINILVAKPDDEKAKQPSPVETVYILDNSGLQPTDYNEVLSQDSIEEFGHIMFSTVKGSSRTDTLKKASSDSDKAIVVMITKVEENYEFEAFLPEESMIKNKHAQALVNVMASSFETSKLIQSGLSTDQLNILVKPVSASYTEVGESTNVIAFTIKLIAPMLFGLMLYIMILLYGQTISKSVSTEKTSKLMETLLTSIHPYALIAGKVLALTAMAILQFVTWIAAGIIGLFGGNAISSVIYPEYENPAITIINFLKDNIGETAFTLPAVIIAIIFFCIGFLFYNVLAGITGCLVSRPEDVASTQSFFQFPVIISWLVCYLSPIIENDTLSSVIRYIPLTSPFCVPVELITGTVGLVEGCLSLTVLLVFTLLLIMLSGRLYKGLILYTGQKISIKMIGNVIKAQK